MIAVFDGKGARVYSRIFVVTVPGQRMEVNLSNMPAGVYMVQLSDASGKNLQKGKLMIF